HPHPQFVGLDLAQIHAPGLDEVCVDAVPLRPGPRLPGRNGPLVQSEGRDDGLDRTAVGEQGHHRDHQLDRVVEAVEGGVAGGAEGLPAALAPIPLLSLALDDDVALSHAPTGATGRVVAELTLGVHGNTTPVGWSFTQPGCARTLLPFKSPPISTVHWSATWRLDSVTKYPKYRSNSKRT